MFNVHHFMAFLSASIALAICPGPGILYVLARSIHGGRKIGYASACGTSLGGMVHVIGAAIGISAILVSSAMAFAAVKYAGAVYLVFLGIKTIRFSKVQFYGDQAHKYGQSTRSAFVQGIWTETLNPKTALFFIAFIPQFIVINQPVIPQFIGYGGRPLCC